MRVAGWLAALDRAEQGIGVKSYIRYYERRFRRDNEEMRQRRRIGDDEDD